MTISCKGWTKITNALISGGFQLQMLLGYFIRPKNDSTTTIKQSSSCRVNKLYMLLKFHYSSYIWAFHFEASFDIPMLMFYNKCAKYFVGILLDAYCSSRWLIQSLKIHTFV